MQKRKLSWNTYTHCTHAVLSADLYAQSVLVNKNFLQRSSVDSLLRERCWLGSRTLQTKVWHLASQVANLE